MATKLKEYAKENQIEIRYEKLKLVIKNKQLETMTKYRFFKPFKSEIPLADLIKEVRDIITHMKK